ncbi:O-antigen ligase family protein [Sediminibacterium roseum]|uniref:O-antigen ligase family protein n=1 Tax=Sediminibacterium roseum TaxID=1978412 RepID=A0ABW9ZXB3_9BACT|nr:O-antigen ligase family protein [Sediminibacterium roseum]NCI51790.1 O-antigen ligase family protein [Sediminibacterium roseum]
MLTNSASYRKAALPVFIFLACGIVAVACWQPLFMLIPFGWVLFPLLYEWLVVGPQKIFWLLCIALPLSTELNITPQLGIDFPDEILLVLLAALVAVKTIHQPSWFPRALLRSSLFLLLVIHLLWILVTCFYSSEPLLSVKYLLAKTWYIIPLVVLPQVLLEEKKDFRKLALCFLLPMLFVVIQVLVRQSLYRFSFADVKKAMAPFFRNHVNYSSMLVCLLPVAWCAWKLTPAGDRRRKWILSGIAIGLAGLLFAYSRGAWIALLAGISAVWVIRGRWMNIVVVAALTVVLVSTVWLATDKNYLRFAPDHDRTVFHTDFSEHLQATVDMKDVSTAERFYRWVAGARMLAERPVTGFGPNGFYSHYKPYTVSSFETWVSDNKEHSTVHNYFLLTALEQGVAGLAFFCTLFFAMLLRVQQLYHRIKDEFYRTIALAIGSILVMIGVVNSLSDMIETDKIGSLFWLCLGLIILLEKKAAAQQPADQ